MSSTDSINNYTTAISNIILNRLAIGNMTEEDAKILRNMLIRIRTDAKLKNANRSFNASFRNLDTSWIAGISSTSNNDIASSAKLASILISLL